MVTTSVLRKNFVSGNSIYCKDFSPRLFPVDPMERDKTKDKIYGILTHSRISAFDKGEESFAYFAFPDTAFSYYIINIDLGGYHRAKSGMTDIVEIQDEVFPVLKNKKLDY
jgi:hypothetical protein